MRYAKLINGEIYCAPNPIRARGCIIGNPPAELLIGEGYKPVNFTEPPEVEPGYIAVPGWEESEEEILQTWTVMEAPDEVDAEEALEILFGGET